ncbi:MAG: hypothetical protein PWR03_1195 [Tenuifilum sp.]|jgi:hypothetical protein|uniref:hypothetical protein n=1 Tax=Tenuifilum sp. TaxID=2760880 RepID=UPI0024AA12D9|nr:hypothetical protein [Tenuifilum sp.]MDI3527012.1 hypothetical protein [Tenuifilum sp.]
MSRLRLNRVRVPAIILLLGLLFFNLSVQSIYFHEHLVNGVYVFHAHPFNKSADSKPVKSHHHTSFELALFQQANVFELSTWNFDFNIHQIESVLGLFNDDSLQVKSLTPFNNRAPPANKIFS